MGSTMGLSTTRYLAAAPLVQVLSAFVRWQDTPTFIVLRMPVGVDQSCGVGGLRNPAWDRRVCARSAAVVFVVPVAGCVLVPQMK